MKGGGVKNSCAIDLPTPSFTAGLLGLDCKFPLREGDGLLPLLLRLQRFLVLGESAADGAGLLRPQVQGQVLLALVGCAEGVPLVLRDHGECGGDRLPHNLDLGELVGGSSGDLGHT